MFQTHNILAQVKYKGITDKESEPFPLKDVRA